jgi:hypothetical protein
MTTTMQKVILTARLKLTLIENLDDGSADLAALYHVRSSPEATSWR